MAELASPFDEFVGRKYHLEKSENFDGLMRAMGVCILFRKCFGKMKPKMTLMKRGDTYVLKSNSGIFMYGVIFRYGKEMSVMSDNNMKLTTTCTEGNNRLIVTETGRKYLKMVFDFSHDELNMTMEVEGVVCRRLFRVK